MQKLARKLQPGDWLDFGPNCAVHVVEVHDKWDGSVMIRHNYGDGYPGGTSFFDADEIVTLA